jgi:hypothetical protein
MEQSTPLEVKPLPSTVAPAANQVLVVTTINQDRNGDFEN